MEVTGFIEIEKVKKGDIFKRKEDSKKVYVKGDYSREKKRYECYDFDDINSFIYLKKGKKVVVNFEF